LKTHLKHEFIALLEYLFIFTRNFGQKRPILDKHKKNLLVILNMSIVTGHILFNQA
jgi:hypothetical protein